MPQQNQKGIAPLIIIILILLSLVLGVWLVQNRTNILPSAQENDANLAPQTAFHLLTSENYSLAESTEGSDTAIAPMRTWFYPGEEIKVNVAVSSDIDAANTFSAIISYPTDLLEVTGIIKENPVIFPQPRIENVTSVSETVRGNDSGYAKPVIQYCDKTADCKKGYQCQSSGQLCPDNEPDCKKSYCVKISPEPKICAQVITRACEGSNCNPDGTVCWERMAACRDFPTPCDVPDGWTIEQPAPEPGSSQIPAPSCRPRPPCLDASPACKMPETSDMCPPSPQPLVKDYFIQFWLPDIGFNNENGIITLSGGVPGDGLLTIPPSKPVMATIIFKAKKIGEAQLKITDESQVLRNSDSVNILHQGGELLIQIKDKDKPVIKGDLDGNGVIEFKDFSILLSKWGTNDPKADINGDGKVNVRDFSILIKNWKTR